MIRVIPLAADATCGRSRAAVNKDVATVMIYTPKEYIPPTDLSKSRRTNLHMITFHDIFTRRRY